MSEPRRRYTKRQKATAIMAAEMTTVAAAAKQTKVPDSTLRQWVNDPRYAKLRAKTREELAEEMRVLAGLAVKALVEKVSRGEVEPRDLVIMLGVAIDKGQLLSGQATSRTEHRDLLSGLPDDESERLASAIDEWLKETAGGASPA